MKAFTWCVVAAIAASAGTASAQTPQANTPMPASVRVQVRTMENVFVTAVRSGVEQIAQKAASTAPGLTLVGGVPHAHGYAVENHGWFFDVEVPELYWATYEVYSQLQRPAPNRQIGNNSGQSSANSIVAQPEPTVTRDDYRRIIREALMDAMLDYGQIPLKATEWLTVGVRSPDTPSSMDDTVALVMQITGEDLTLFRQTKITRDEAKKRIKIRQEQR